MYVICSNQYLNQKLRKSKHVRRTVVTIKPLVQKQLTCDRYLRLAIPVDDHRRGWELTLRPSTPIPIVQIRLTIFRFEVRSWCCRRWTRRWRRRWTWAWRWITAACWFGNACICPGSNSNALLTRSDIEVSIVPPTGSPGVL
jgi:hypothetical protein